MIRNTTLLTLVLFFHIGCIHANSNIDALHEQISQIFEKRSMILNQLENNIKKRKKITQEEDLLISAMHKKNKSYEDQKIILQNKMNQAIFWHYNQKKILWQQLTHPEHKIDGPALCQYLVEKANQNSDNLLRHTKSIEKTLSQLNLEKKQYDTMYEEQTLILSQLDEEESILKSLILELEQEEATKNTHEPQELINTVEQFTFTSLSTPLSKFESRESSDFLGASIIHGDIGEPIQAIADGTVIFADHLKGLGNMIIVEHTDQYISLYANCDDFTTQIGHKIQKGEIIAHVGKSGTIGKEALYFELRHAGEIIPSPESWYQ